MSRSTRNRVPAKYFVTCGSGDSDNQVHAGSFHMALHEAGISDFNIQTYSSVLPACAKEVSREAAKLPKFGSEMMTIMAVANGEKGDFICAGITYGWLYEGRKKIGGLVCEVSGKMEVETLAEELEKALTELHERTYRQYELKDIQTHIMPHRVGRKHGTALVAICFTQYK